MSRYTFEINGERYTVDIEPLEGEQYRVRVGEHTYDVRYIPESQTVAPTVPSSPAPAAETPAEGGTRVIQAPMPGTVLDIHVRPGDTVTYGQPLLVLEAMKMKNHIRAPIEGTVTAVHVREGEQVAYGTPLVELQGRGENAK